MEKRLCPCCDRPTSEDWRCGECGALLKTRSYEVDGLLAIGPRGRVYRARSPSGPVAIKELAFAVVPDVTAIDRFDREASVLRALHHPRMPAFLESFSEGTGIGQRLYLVQRRLPGENLEARLLRHFFDEAEARAIAADVLDVLGYLHSRSPLVIHRDLKPGNILDLGPPSPTQPPSGTPNYHAFPPGTPNHHAFPPGTQLTGYAVVDFGAVTLLGRSDPTSSWPEGTFGYVPPERLARGADASCDLYALGVTLARILSRLDVASLLTNALTVDFRPYVNVSAPFADFIGRLVAPDPKSRFRSAAEALSALRTLPQPGAMVARAPPAEATRMLEITEEPIQWVSAYSLQTWTDVGPPWILRVGRRHYGLRCGFRYLLGRGAICELHVPIDWNKADTVSRRHAELEVFPSGLRIRDLGSRNGTFVGALGLSPSGAPLTLKGPSLIGFGKLLAEASPAVRAGVSP